eukprot:gnl/TRDRNA2_/TRDRNA2_171238_c0_seq2.p1 gnl/TRDRNA2_/TRDRNA2_171238_c0~~gnl/TRDRNA2_/TRDRNA2_171238_c0_seq2.p1  ORF type:complete len:755 (+),score=110.56 gnl/TRDRNA2_/TRDRNA2_171238_c0_seq2:53-2266(+)
MEDEEAGIAPGTPVQQDTVAGFPGSPIGSSSGPKATPSFNPELMPLSPSAKSVSSGGSIHSISSLKSTLADPRRLTRDITKLMRSHPDGLPAHQVALELSNATPGAALFDGIPGEEVPEKPRVSRAARRVVAIRWLTGGAVPSHKARTHAVAAAGLWAKAGSKSHHRAGFDDVLPSAAAREAWVENSWSPQPSPQAVPSGMASSLEQVTLPAHWPTVHFSSSTVSAVPGASSVVMGLRLDPLPSDRPSYRLANPVKVAYCFQDGTTGAPAELSAEKPVTEIVVPLHMQPTDSSAPFTVRLTACSDGARLGTPAACMVYHQGDDKESREDSSKHSVLTMMPDTLDVLESEGKATIIVLRRFGLSARCSCLFRTRDGQGKSAAVAGKDYMSVEGELVFEAGESEKRIEVSIIDDGVCERDEHFFVEIFDATNATFDASTNGGEEKCTCIVTIVNDDIRRRLVDNISSLFGSNADQLELAHIDYARQFSAALKGPAGGLDDEEEGASHPAIAWVMHVLNLPWKIAFAFVPPTGYLGGWLCFCVALFFIGVLTAIIGDFASHLGSALGLKPSVVAITFVALGTSLPDTFASRAAAVNDPTADAAIGNVTGSNAVNVFLGLGLPWMMAALYWSSGAETGTSRESRWLQRYGSDARHALGTGFVTPISDQVIGFVVPAGDLGVSVGVFSGCAMCVLATFVARRWFLGCELGGPKTSKLLTSVFFISLWLFYIFISSLKAYDLL